jgi:hypothetical protein
MNALQLEALSRAMTGGSSLVRYVDAGYTYFGQFVSHEIVAERQPGGRPVSHRMELESLYGTHEAQLLGPDGRFRNATGIGGALLDLPRDPTGVATIPERRNDDNVIVAQLHLFWQQLHNFTLSSRCASNGTQARKLVTQVFQLLVVEDYLRQLLAPDVFCAYFHEGQRWLDLGPLPMPPVFSHAVFRFGHSMVRRAYDGFPHNGVVDVPLPELFRRGQPLDLQHQVDWRAFFGWPRAPRPPQGAMAIDVRIASGMAQVPVPGHGVVNIVRKNLEAGIAADLLPGKRYAQRFGIEPLLNLGELEDLLPPGSGIDINNLPLWPYVLLEAMHPDNGHGRRLGPLGSAICAQVLADSIVNARPSIYESGFRPVDEVLKTLGALGERIQAVRQANAHLVARQRSFCMRHIIDLVMGL